MSGDLNLPFEEGPTGQTIDLNDDATVAGGLVALAACVPVPGRGIMPAVVFRVAEPHGEFHHPVVLVLEPAEMAALGKLVGDAATAAVKAAAA